jgi:hypothetical protein
MHGKATVRRARWCVFRSSILPQKGHFFLNSVFATGDDLSRVGSAGKTRRAGSYRGRPAPPRVGSGKCKGLRIVSTEAKREEVTMAFTAHTPSSAGTHQRRGSRPTPRSG